MGTTVRGSRAPRARKYAGFLVARRSQYMGCMTDLAVASSVPAGRVLPVTIRKYHRSSSRAKFRFERVMRGLFGYLDREGGGARLAYDGPRIVACLQTHPQVHDAAIVTFYDRGARHNLYAFVEAGSTVSEPILRDFVTTSLPQVEPPQHIQVAQALPRHRGGGIRTELLQLVASNQLDQVESLITSDDERAIVAQIVAERRNLRDRF